MTEPAHVSTTRAVYDATAERYVQFAGTQVSAGVEGPLDRAVLGAFAEMAEIAEIASGTVADVGCGPGRVAAFLHDRGLDVVGVDLSEAMIRVARGAHPDIVFEHGSLTALPFEDGSLRGAVCWYSIIHTPPEALGPVWSELARVLAAGGQLLVAFQAGDGETLRRIDAYGTGVELTNYRHDPEHVTDSLCTAGFDVRARAIREAEFDHESSPQAFVLARRVGSGG